MERPVGDGNRRKTLKWTPAEVDAVRRGFYEFGMKWTNIKNKYSSILAARSPKDIRDKAKYLKLFVDGASKGSGGSALYPLEENDDTNRRTSASLPPLTIREQSDLNRRTSNVSKQNTRGRGSNDDVSNKGKGQLNEGITRTSPCPVATSSKDKGQLNEGPSGASTSSKGTAGLEQRLSSPETLDKGTTRIEPRLSLELGEPANKSHSYLHFSILSPRHEAGPSSNFCREKKNVQKPCEDNDKEDDTDPCIENEKEVAMEIFMQSFINQQAAFKIDVEKAFDARQKAQKIQMSADLETLFEKQREDLLELLYSFV